MQSKMEWKWGQMQRRTFFSEILESDWKHFVKANKQHTKFNVQSLNRPKTATKFVSLRKTTGKNWGKLWLQAHLSLVRRKENGRNNYDQIKHEPWLQKKNSWNKGQSIVKTTKQNWSSKLNIWKTSQWKSYQNRGFSFDVGSFNTTQWASSKISPAGYW